MINQQVPTRALALVAQFLNEIGIATVPDEEASGFLPTVEIRDGTLRYRPDCHSSDLLHEAGHVACVPSGWRATMSGNIARAQRRMCDEVMASEYHPDSPEYRAVIQCGDPEATAWAWAAGTHLGLAPDEIIRHDDPDAYGGEGASIAACLAAKVYIGINGLQHAGFCRAGPFGDTTRPRYPELRAWLQD